MLFAARRPHLHAQQITNQAPPLAPQATVPARDLPNAPSYPDAVPVVPSSDPESPVIESATQSYAGGVFTLDGDVVITSGVRRVEADHIVYDSASGELTASGHLVLTSGVNQERITAARGAYNLKTATGRFFDVSGSVGVRVKPGSKRVVYTTGNPFLFSGRMVVKTGPRDYDIYDGSITSCRLPKPDWLLTAKHFSVDADTARAHNSTFRLLNVPIVYLPYVTHAVEGDDRQSGLLIPIIGQYNKSGTKGVEIGEQIYLVLNRSADLTLGADFYSSIGFAQNAAFRYRGFGQNFLTFRYNGVLDRRTGTLNQGGEDAVAAGRRDFTDHTRAATNIEYLSSYTYREAFSNNFNQAVTSDIVSTAYLTHQTGGFEVAGYADRYQGIKLIAQGTTPQQQVRIFHAPTLSFSATDHRLGRTAFELSGEASASGLKRTQPNFASGGIVERIDLHPQLSLPLHPGGWNLLASVGARETVYDRSRLPPAPGQPLTEDPAALSRSSVEFVFAANAPVIERTFQPTRFTRLLGEQVRHTIAPEVTYRRTAGISNFSQVLRFDDVDVAADTNEIEYGVVQRLFRRPARKHPCPAASDLTNGLDALPDTNGSLTPNDSSGAVNDGVVAEPEDAAATKPSDCRSQELISWRLTQKYFFDSTFGSAIQTGRRNIFDTTLALSGVAFLTEPREISPLVSRFRFRTSANVDIEWDFDLDTGAKKFTSSNVYLDLHAGNSFTALSYARLDAPGRFYTQGDSSVDGSTTGVSSAISDFNQLRYLVGYGNPSKPGLSIAANVGIDLKALYGTASRTTTASASTTSIVYPPLFQYAAAQTSYNWNCCGLAFEYRKFELGSVRNENSYRFNFTLANIGTAGNLRRAERLF